MWNFAKFIVAKDGTVFGRCGVLGAAAIKHLF
jgi:glutathione peroxidase-family protein